MPIPRIWAAVAATLCVAGTSVLSTASASPSSSGGTAAAGAHVSAGSVGLTTLGLGGWRVQSSAIATQTGHQISTPGFPTAMWLAVTPDDAGAPGTEIEAVLQNGGCPDIFFSNNMQKCFGIQRGSGPVIVKRFAVPWWYRTDFTPSLQPGQDAKLIINGVVGKADVWVNGRQVAWQYTVQGYIARFTFDISRLIRPGTNSLAIEVQPNDPTKLLTVDFVDWNQVPLDDNTGIQFPIQLQVANALGISNAHVMQQNAPDLSSSALTVKADITNTTATPQAGMVSATITPPPGGGPIHVQQSVSVPANTVQTVEFAPSSYSQLVIAHPQVWWPYQMGQQPLYHLTTAVSQPGTTADTRSEDFGIRTIESHLTPPSPNAPAKKGARAFSVNGKAFVVRGGGWAENIFLHYSAQDLATQIPLIKSMGLNAIRTEGHDMPDDFYQQMDRAGILIDAGFQCCDAWEPSSQSSITPHEYGLFYLSALAIGQRLRNHPSVMNYSWSDNQPFPLQEVVVLDGFHQADFQEQIISSAEYKSSPILGPSGEKEGPYDWVPPSYWYDSTHANPGDTSQTNVGGSWAFDSEESAGHTVPTLDSIQRFMSAADQATLWQNPAANQYHANWETGHNGYAFGTLFNLDRAVRKRYGSWSSLNQYVELAQLQNYEDTRSQFEAFIDHWTNKPTPSTGTIYWQLNKGWPTLLWSLYNYDYDQAGAYFGAKKANESVHVLYAYDNNTVTVDNLSGVAQSGLSVESKVYDINGTVLDDQVRANISLASQAVHNAVITPKVPANTAPPTPAQTYFVELIMKQHGVAIDRNVYWHSTQQDIVDWPNTIGNPQATMKQFADMRALQTLPQPTVAATASTSPGPGGRDITRVKITNTSSTPTVGFFLRADVRQGNADATVQAGDNQVLPITWSDNDITLWPGESQTLTATYDAASLHGATPVVSIFGVNVPRFDVPAGSGAATMSGLALTGGGWVGSAWIPEGLGAPAW